MKVELQCGDKITIPEGCKAIVKDNSNNHRYFDRTHDYSMLWE